MNIQQLEYIIAVDNFRHFARAAEACSVTQPTLSMMIQRLEDELDVKIFDRFKHPVEPTAVGQNIIKQARALLRQFDELKEIASSEHKTVKGSFRLGIIPTIASYLVPVLLQKHRDDCQGIELTLKESTTNNLINEILTGKLDGGILAGPLNNPELSEIPLYYEKFYAYVSPDDKAYAEKEIDLDTVDVDRIWLLENEHCLRKQIEYLCRLKEKKAESKGLKYEAGSIETLIHVVDYNSGITIIPEMHAIGLDEERQDNLRSLKNRIAVREVNLAVSGNYVRRAMLDVILNIVRSSVPKSMQNPDLKKFAVGIFND
ncbi:MAG: hydrogen peroxide-inducible genes activator [Prevotellaceae bacterium]|jgi:LysR family hydrogen peroxide-inducible transcriptional activator|nr:hydrogen peroxide-inducible genes activator [Prevotellaceae bacterium]